MSQRRQKWYTEIVAKKMPKLPDNPSPTQEQNHKAIKSLRIIARGGYPTGQKLITSYFFPLDQTKAPKFREGTGGQRVLMECFTSSQIARARKNPTKHGPEVLTSSKLNFEIAYKPQRHCVCAHYRRNRGDPINQMCRFSRPPETSNQATSATQKKWPVVNLEDGQETGPSSGGAKTEVKRQKR